MTISFQLAPIPKWYIADLTGKPLGGGYMATYNSPNKTLLQVVFQDPAGQLPWPYVSIPNTGLQGILFDENGAQGPFYWEVDTAHPENTYYVEVFDANGVLQWTIDNYGPPGDGGGGGGTTVLSIDNLVTNNVMYRNIGTESPPVIASPPTSYKLMIAPGAHQGLANTPSNANPDIWFFKNNSAATDSLTFTTFSSSASMLNGDVTPVEYLNYTCSLVGAGETSKYVQFPITQDAYNLNNQAATLSIWARVNSGASTLTLKWRQFFGDGGTPTADQITIIQNLALANVWQQFVVSANIPPLPSPLTTGTCGNGGLFLQVSYPLTALTSIDFTKPAIYLGANAPATEYETYDMISSVIDSPRTGDISTSLTNSWLTTLAGKKACPYGWVEMDDGTIGSETSGASTRANIDTFPLYNLIWNSVSRTWAPIVGATTGTAIGDFNANLPLYLTRALGRVFAGTLNTEISQTFTFTLAPAQTTATVASSIGFVTGAPIKLTTTGTLPSPLAVGTTYYVINVDTTHIKFATTLDNAVAGTAIIFDGTTPPTAGTQTVTVTPYELGQAIGEDAHTLTAAEIPTLTIDAMQESRVGAPTGGGNIVTATGGLTGYTDHILGVTTNTGGGAHNTIQPTTYMNVYIKL